MAILIFEMVVLGDAFFRRIERVNSLIQPTKYRLQLYFVAFTNDT